MQNSQQTSIQPLKNSNRNQFIPQDSQRRSYPEINNQSNQPSSLTSHLKQNIMTPNNNNTQENCPQQMQNNKKPMESLPMNFKQQSEYFPNNQQQQIMNQMSPQYMPPQMNNQQMHMQQQNPQQQHQMNHMQNQQQQYQNQNNGGMFQGQFQQGMGMQQDQQQQQWGRNNQHQMDQHNYGHQQQQQNPQKPFNTDNSMKEDNQKRRRARTDPNNRDYQCPCGKSYLSYPALYTHIKQKHDGKAPGDVIRPKGNNPKRGRPVGKTTNNMKDKDDDDFDNDSNISYEALQQLDSLQLFIHDQLGPNATLNDNREHTKEELKQNFPKDDFFESEDDYKVLYDIYCDVIERNGEIQETLNDKKLYNTNCNQIFAIFLYNVSKHLQLDLLKEMGIFVCLFRKTVNKYGWSLKQRIEQEERQEQNVTNNNGENNVASSDNTNNNLETTTSLKNVENKDQNEYCAMNGAHDIIEISNDFITSEMPKYFRIYQNKMQDLQIVKEEQNLNRVVPITQYFCNWLYHKKYTDTQIQPNNEADDDI